MNAITLLKADHKVVEELFRQFEKLGEKSKGKKAIVDRVIKELSTHAAIEEQVFYPAIRREMPKTEDDVLEALEEHHIVKWTLSELAGMEVDAERYDAKVTVLMESVRHHVKEEEKELFPQVSKALGRKRLEDLGASLESAKKMAPTRPHPRAPDAPPGNTAINMGAGLVDRARDIGKSVIERAEKATRPSAKTRVKNGARSKQVEKRAE